MVINQFTNAGLTAPCCFRKNHIPDMAQILWILLNLLRGNFCSSFNRVSILEHLKIITKFALTIAWAYDYSHVGSLI